MRHYMSRWALTTLASLIIRFDYLRQSRVRVCRAERLIVARCRLRKWLVGFVAGPLMAACGIDHVPTGTSPLDGRISFDGEYCPTATNISWTNCRPIDESEYWWLSNLTIPVAADPICTQALGAFWNLADNGLVFFYTEGSQPNHRGSTLQDSTGVGVAVGIDDSNFDDPREAMATMIHEGLHVLAWNDPETYQQTHSCMPPL
jgi:hypothetical protein